MLVNAPKQPPYEGAKDKYLVENVDDKEFLRDLFIAIEAELPLPKKGK